MSFIASSPVHHTYKAHNPGCRTLKCDQRVGRRWWVKHHPTPVGWAIPEYIVICESKGVNLPPNSATASGYYQITNETWPEGNGSPPNEAWKHSRAEQDRVARNLWNGGAGSGRWKECGG